MKKKTHDWVIELKTGHSCGGPGCFYGIKDYGCPLKNASLWGRRSLARDSADADEVVRKVRVKNGVAVKVIPRA